MAEVDDIGKLIAAINPDYAENGDEVKSLLKEGFDKAVDKAKPKPVEEHKIVYDSSSETLEPIYFWIVDLMNQMAGKVEKIVDNFTSSPGGGHFAEMMGRASQMQAEVSKILGTVNTIIKTIMNLLYDLKEFEIRLRHYEAAKSTNKEEAEAGNLALKQIWMDNVDVKKGRGSINMLAQDLNFITIRDAFMIVKTLEDVDKLDLNDRVRRMLKPRLQEYIEWVDKSGIWLRKSYEVERSYLKSEVSALKLYTRWAKPYLKAASELQPKDLGRSASVVKAFNTVVLQLTLLGKKEVNFEQAIVEKKLPQSFKKNKLKRPYYSCILVDFNFRGIPQRVGQHYVFGGRAEVTFKGYALNEQEIKMLYQKLDESDISDALKLVSGVTDESLEQLRGDIEYFLKEEEKKEKKVEEEINPFAALLGGGEKKEEKKDKTPEKILKVDDDNYIEKLIRKVSQDTAAATCFSIFDIYKKAHGMASHPNPFD